MPITSSFFCRKYMKVHNTKECCLLLWPQFSHEGRHKELLTASLANKGAAHGQSSQEAI